MYRIFSYFLILHKNLLPLSHPYRFESAMCIEIMTPYPTPLTTYIFFPLFSGGLLLLLFVNTLLFSICSNIMIVTNRSLRDIRMRTYWSCSCSRILHHNMYLYVLILTIGSALPLYSVIVLFNIVPNVLLGKLGQKRILFQSRRILNLLSLRGLFLISPCSSCTTVSLCILGFLSDRL